MATIANARLTINLSLPANQADVVVECVVRFTQLEMFLMQNGLRFRLDCKVWGEDLGQGNWLDADDFLFTYDSKFFPDASPTQVENVTGQNAFRRRMNKNVINEDSGTDEIYGELTLTNLENNNKVKLKTNVIHQQIS